MLTRRNWQMKQFIWNEIFVKKLADGRIRLRPLSADLTVLTLMQMGMRFCQSLFRRSERSNLIRI